MSIVCSLCSRKTFILWQLPASVRTVHRLAWQSGVCTGRAESGHLQFPHDSISLQCQQDHPPTHCCPSASAVVGFLGKGNKINIFFKELILLLCISYYWKSHLWETQFGMLRQCFTLVSLGDKAVPSIITWQLMCGLPFKLTTAPGIVLDHLFTLCFGMGSFFASVFVSKLLHSCGLVACACFAGVRGQGYFCMCVHALQCCVLV